MKNQSINSNKNNDKTLINIKSDLKLDAGPLPDDLVAEVQLLAQLKLGPTLAGQVHVNYLILNL